MATTDSTPISPDSDSIVAVTSDAKTPSAQIYEDDVHIRVIRAALAKGNAAVLVGAGFSRNAEGGEYVGTWEHLAKALAEGMAPMGRVLEASVANATQLAEQYEQLFSRSQLEQVLKTVVPDERLSPGPLHIKLLSLGWSEVFTTNYDTLLERTAERLLDSSYFTVCCREDIPLSRILGRRRIVKLHGSFASQRPFIVTEEDYRTYPQEFAPFVNLVRQALLENILCLVGFSGDDPNFLSWIGWVRDMLDTHALPIYLFVTEEPPRGQMLLLKARGVTPVVLPDGNSSDVSDYAGRYGTLLNLINPDHEAKPEDWGSLSWPSYLTDYQTDSSKIYEKFCKTLPLVAAHRKKYPGWLVAPHNVRRKLRNAFRSLDKWIIESSVQKHLKCDDHAFVLAAIEIYCWVQSVALDEMDDFIAEQAIQALKASENFQFLDLSAHLRDRLKEIDCSSQSAFSGCWTRVLLSTMAWARQTQRVTVFEELKKIAIKFRGQDALVQDHLAYHSVLLHLENGDRPSAQQTLRSWSVRGSDAYMQIRWASLCAELGNRSTAIATCESALQNMRRQLRMNPDDFRVLSEESWASMVALNIIKALDLAKDFHALELIEDGKNLSREDSDALSRKLEINSERYSSRTELHRAMEQLGREAGVPYARNFRYNEFESGTVSNVITFGAPGFVHRKVEAAASWFQLTEHVGLVPRTPGVSFYSEEFIQAAWWMAYYHEQHDRALGILLRCARESALKPRDETKPLHETGWLSRFEVALISSKRATTLAIQLKELVISMLASSPQNARGVRDLGFYTEVLGRIIIRVEDLDVVQSIAMELLGLYASGPLARLWQTWQSISKLLMRCMEALNEERQLDVLARAFTAPLLPPTKIKDVFESSWLPIELFGRHIEESAHTSHRASQDFKDSLSSLVAQLQKISDVRLTSRIWQRLLIADRLKLLDETQRKAIEDHLWADWRPSGMLPKIPDFHAHAVFPWAGGNLSQVQEAYKREFIDCPFNPIKRGSLPIEGTQISRGWIFPSDETQTVSLSVLGSYNIPIKKAEFIAIINKFSEWIDRDGADLARDMARNSDLLLQTSTIIDDIDFMILQIHIRSANIFAADAEVLSAIQKLKSATAIFKQQTFGLDILLAQWGDRPMEKTASLGELELRLTSEDIGALRNASRTAASLIRSKAIVSHQGKQAIFDALVRATFCNSAVPMIYALGELSRLPAEVWLQHLSDRNLYLLDGALEELYQRLAWVKRLDRRGIPDDAVPLLRSSCASLAHALRKFARYESPAAVKWLTAAVSDPLPELRLGRFAH